MVVQRLRLHTPSAGGLGNIHGQGTGVHMPQLSVSMEQCKIPTGRNKDQKSCVPQVRPGAAKYFFKKKKKKDLWM